MKQPNGVFIECQSYRVRWFIIEQKRLFQLIRWFWDMAEDWIILEVEMDLMVLVD